MGYSSVWSHSQTYTRKREKVCFIDVADDRVTNRLNYMLLCVLPLLVFSYLLLLLKSCRPSLVSRSGSLATLRLVSTIYNQ